MVTVDGTEVDYSGLPEFCREVVRLYIETGAHPGSGWYTILSNDLRAVYMVDAETAKHLPQIVRWLHNHAPSDCHGSGFMVRDWMIERARSRRKGAPDATGTR